MSVKHFPLGNKDLDGFVGYRVHRSVGGKIRQAYFSVREDGILATPKRQSVIHQAAIDQDLTWLAEAQQLRQQKAVAAKPSARADSGTSVAGISAQRIGRRSTLSDGRPGRRYWPTWTVHVQSSRYRRFYLTRLGDQGAFDQAVDHLCQVKGWSTEQADRLKSRWIPHRYGDIPTDVPDEDSR